MSVSTPGPRVGVITFPGSLDDGDALRAVELMGGVGVPLWHADRDLRGVDAVVLPGGFSYGDYLRCGAIARFAAVMEEVVAKTALKYQEAYERVTGERFDTYAQRMGVLSEKDWETCAVNLNRLREEHA